MKENENITRRLTVRVVHIVFNVCSAHHHHHRQKKDLLPTKYSACFVSLLLLFCFSSHFIEFSYKHQKKFQFANVERVTNRSSFLIQLKMQL